MNSTGLDSQTLGVDGQTLGLGQCGPVARARTFPEVGSSSPYRFAFSFNTPWSCAARPFTLRDGVRRAGHVRIK